MLSLVVLVVPFIPLMAQSTTWNGNADTNWFNPANWSNGVPGPSTAVNINFINNNRDEPVLNASTTIGSLSMSSNNQTLTIGAGVTLTVNGNLNTGNSANIVGTDFSLDVGGNMDLGNDLNVTDGGSPGTLTVDGNLSVANNKTFDARFATVTIGGTLSLNGQINLHTADLTAATININNNGTLNVQSGSATLTNASVNDGDILVDDGTFTILGNFTHTSSALLEIQTGTVNVGSPGPPVVGGNFIQTGGSEFFLNQGSFNVYGSSTFTGGGDFSAGDGQILFQGDVALNGGSDFDAGSSTVTLSGDVNLSSNSNQDVTFHNLVIDDATTVTADIDVTVANNMTVDPTGDYNHVNETTLNVIGTVTGEPEIDVNRPYVVSIEVVTANRLRIFFNTEFEGNPISLIPGTGTNAAERAANYQVLGSGETPATASLINANTVEIEFNPAVFTIQDNTQYTLWIQNLRIQENNTTNGQISTNHYKFFGGASFTVPQPLVLDYYPGGLDNTNLQIWFDAADPQTRFSNPSGTAQATNGQTIARLNDKSPAGRHAIQPTSALRPELSLTGAFGARPSLIFNNAEFLPFDGTWLAGTEYTLGFFVDRSTDSGGRNIYFGGTGGGENTNLHLFWANSTTLEFHHWNNNFDVTVPAYTPDLAGEIHTFNLNTSLGSNARSAWRNGALLGTGGTNATLISMEGASLGAYQNAEFFRGRFGETYMYDRLLNTTERLILENYAAAKWGTTLAPASDYYNGSNPFTHQLAGIGRTTSTDHVLSTAFTSGGLGLQSTTAEFLSTDGHFLLSAHNNATGLHAQTLFTATALYERPNRVWYADITQPGSGGEVTISFDLDVLDVTPGVSTGQYGLLFNASQDDFSIFEDNQVLSSAASVSGNIVSFTIDSDDLQDGYLTLGFFLSTAEADPAETTIAAQPTVIEADGASTSQITVQARFANGANRTVGGDAVTLSTTSGTLSAVSDNGDGTYTAVLTSANSAGTATITGTINGDPITSQATVTFQSGAPDPAETLLSATTTSLVANGTDQSTVTVQLRDTFGANLTTGGAVVTLSITSGSLSAVTDNGDGTYTATLTAPTQIGTATLTAAVNGSPTGTTLEFDYTAGPADLAESTLQAVPDQITANGTAQSTIVLEVRDANGNLVGSGGQTVVFSTTSGTLGTVTDLNNGTYTIPITAPASPGSATVSATLNGNPVTATATVTFVDFDILRYYPAGLANDDLQVWFDVADDSYAFSDAAATTPAAFGDPVAVLRDKSPNARHAEQADAARRPVRSNTGAFGGRPSLIFDNAEFLPFDGTWLTGTDYTLTFMVDRSEQLTGRNIYFGGATSGANQNLHLFWNGNTTFEHHHWGNNYTATVPAFTTSIDGELHTFNLNTAIPTPSRRFWRNGTQIGSGGTAQSLTSMNGAALGRFRTTDYFRGRIGEVVMHDRVLNTTEFILLQNYLSARWGVGIDANITYFTPPDPDFYHQLSGIGRITSTDLVNQTVFTSGGLGFNATGAFTFLTASQRYLMAAHNNLTGLAASTLAIGESSYERWNRVWYLEKSVVTTGGTLAVYFDFTDYNLPVPDPNDTFVLLYHPTDGDFATAGVQVITATASFSAVNRVQFAVNADDLENGYYTVGRLDGTVIYYSRTSGNYEDAPTWSVTGHDGPAHSEAPGPTSTVIIGGNAGTDHEVTLTANVTLNAGGTITVTDTGDGSGILLTGARIILGDGSFTLEEGGTLGIGSPDGIAANTPNGNIRTASRSFSADATYRYNGAAAQITGSGLPASVLNLQVSNAAGVTLTNNLQVTGTATLTSGNLTVSSDQAFVAENIAYNGGLLRALRQLWVPPSGTPGGWRLLSSPINTDYANLFSELTTQGFTGSDLGVSSSLIPSVLWYDETFEGTDNQRWRAPDNATDDLTPGRGLFTYVFGDVPTDSRYNQSAVTLEVIGQENAGDVSLPVTYTATGDEGWNLVGNPYLSTIFWNDASGWTKTNISPTIYVWDQQANGGNGDFLEWNGVAGWGNGYIKPFQGFWVKATADNPELQVNTSARSTTTSGTFYRRPAHPEIEFQVTTTDSLSSRALFMFTDQARTGIDPLDAYRLESLSDTYITLFSVNPDGDRLAINNLPDRFARTLELPMDLDATVQGQGFSGSVELALNRFQNLPEDWVIELEDRQTGEVYDRSALEAGISLSLTTSGTLRKQSASGTDSLWVMTYPKAPIADRTDGPALMKSNPSRARFIITITPTNPPSDIPAGFGLQQNYPNPFNPTTTVPFALAADGRVRLEVFDITGRRLAVLLDEFRQAGFYEVSWNAGQVASGIYIYRMITPEGSFTRKMTLIR